MKEKPILILGAGPAGMATVMELWRERYPLIVVEKNEQVGGLARTLTFREGNDVFRTDIGPHRFYSKNAYLYRFIEDLLGEDWIKVKRLTRFYIDGQFYFYPIELKDVLQKTGSRTALKILLDYATERLRDIGRRRQPKNFEEYAVFMFGRRLAELNMLNYTEKIWGLPCSQLSVDWSQRIRGLSFMGAVINAVRGHSHDTPKTMVDSFYYPSHGTGLIYQKIYERTRDRVRYTFQSTVKKITHDNGTVRSVTITTPQGEEVISPQTVVSSIPVVELIRLLDPPPAASTLQHASQLRYRSQVYLFITLNKERVFPDQWIYIPELSVPFGRISEMKNFSAAMAPPHATSLFVEFFCWEGDDTWNATKEELLARCLPFFQQWGWCEAKDIRQLYLHRQSNVYPVYDLAYAKHLQVLKRYLDSFTNLYTIGRPGRFKYNNQDHSLEMGIMAARSIREGKRYDFDEVMKEEEYLESGHLPPKTT